MNSFKLSGTLASITGLLCLVLANNLSFDWPKSSLALSTWVGIVSLGLLSVIALITTHRLRRYQSAIDRLRVSTQLLIKSCQSSTPSNSDAIDDSDELDSIDPEHVLLAWPRQSRHHSHSLSNTIEQLFLTQRSAFEQQKSTSDKLKTMLDCAADAIFTLDQQGHIVSFNRAAENLFGYSAHSLINQSASLLLPPEHRANFDDYVKNRVLSGTSGFYGQGREVSGYTQTGETLPIHLAMSAIDTLSGPYFTCIMRDISEQKRHEKALIAAKEEAEQHARYKSDFLACMSHEIRTPMNGVLGMLELLSKSPINDHQQELVTVAQSSAQSLLSLINDILDFSKIEAGKLDIESIRFDLHQHMGELMQLMSYRAQEKGLELILDMVDTPNLLFEGDPNRIRQIFMNLISNAIKFTDRGEVLVTFSAKPTDHQNQWLFQASVKDTGIGIPADRQSALFDSFTQVDASTTRKYGGTGLGLAIVKKLCELMRGSITVESHLGDGSLFTITLPLMACSDQPIQSSPSLDGQRCLIIDDNASVRSVLRRQLQQWGAQSWEAESGVAALTLLEKHRFAPFHAAFIDLNMPDIDGLSLAASLQTDPRCKPLQHIALTSFGGHNNALLQEHGFSEALCKPFLPRTLHNLFSLSPKPALIESPLITQPQKLYETTQSPKASISGKQLLLVEDNPVNQQVAQYLLESLGCSTVIADNGAQALEHLASDEHRFDAILMDCHMPIMDGYEASRKIRTEMDNERNRRLPIIAMTANVMPEDRQLCLDAGMDDHLAKPIEVKKLQQLLSHWLSTPAERDSEPEYAPLPASNADSTTLSTTHHIPSTSTPWLPTASLARVRGKRERLVHLIELFLKDTPDRLAQLETAIHAADQDVVHHIAHTLKGVVGNLDHRLLMELAGDIEHSASPKHRIPTPKFEQLNLLATWKQHYLRFEQQLLDYLHPHTSATDKNTEPQTQTVSRAQ